MEKLETRALASGYGLDNLFKVASKVQVNVPNRILVYISTIKFISLLFTQNRI